ncbi:hypothetical protein F4560_005143 [Saccharothrix ecbatanensis]|uniref:Uncharacterized protein n=1 Tax=Saccharothrix ecbatanensis TaxID=1105145 RepID=A0A7W9M2V6_9PSEU|nr:hypothetical protein [Saccharothrix ecbatanensis]MBB5805375.1 hypothetical protein [Saccharothrix ecbatanensis]
MNDLAGVGQSTNVDRVFTALLHEVAKEEAPRFFAIVEEYGNAEDARVAGYGLAYADRAEVDAVEGGFRLSSESAESARTLFEITSGDEAVRRVHLVWLN